MSELNEAQIQYLADLRDPEKKQTTGVMKRSFNGVDRFCCMGVACDRFAPETLLELDNYTGAENTTYGADDGHGRPLVSEMPRRVNEALGLDDADNASMASMNDFDGLSFKEIADILEEFWKSGRGPGRLQDLRGF